MFKVWLSFNISSLLKKNISWGLPIAISVEPTTSCNLRCPECPSGLRSFTRPTGMLEPRLLRSLTDQLKSTLSYVTLYFQGEPFLNRDIFELIEIADNRKIYTTISTNAHYLNEENAEKTVKSGLDKLIISIDGTTQETYQSYRIGGSLEKVLEGTKNIVEAKKKLKSSTPYIMFQFLVVKPNEHQIEDARKLANEFGVDHIGFKTAQIYNYKNGSPLIPTIDYYSRYKKQEDDTYVLKNKLEDKCWRMWHACVMTWDGKIVPCCFDKDAQHVLGDINEQGFKQIWRGESYNKFRTTLLNGRKHIDICKNCTEGVKVWG